MEMRPLAVSEGQDDETNSPPALSCGLTVLFRLAICCGLIALFPLAALGVWYSDSWYQPSNNCKENSPNSPSALLTYGEQPFADAGLLRALAFNQGPPFHAMSRLALASRWHFPSRWHDHTIFRSSDSNLYLCKGHTDETQLLFIHVHQTGGTELKHFANHECKQGRNSTFDQLKTSSGASDTEKLSETRTEYGKELFFFSLVRDPVERFVSGVQELEARGNWRANASALPSSPVTQLLAQIREQDDFSIVKQYSLILPQYNFLVGAGEWRRLDWIGKTELMREAKELVHHLLVTPDDKRTEDLNATSGTTYSNLAPPTVVHDDKHTGVYNTSLTNLYWPTPADVREICIFYAVDYISFQIEVPHVCRDLFVEEGKPGK